ncbi:Spindle pole body component [Trichophyton interdigitale]|uniref:Spindle pole body component n=1 Tax=Trichophyton interdigitale TaxID=101480 RepID=A0A9P4YI88_9EURO|nr:Spindle pole body component [Trichophyton interdigitale]KAF3895395.1 Spindle pole body component [Trichophyton interdigitale]KAG8212439.1 Spindle pole body component [Trichophyton interdigitale]
MEFESPEDPFELDVLQEPVFFTIEPIKPLENYPWDDALPDLTAGLFESPIHLFKDESDKVHSLNIFGDEKTEEPGPPSVAGSSSSSAQHDSQEEPMDDISGEDDIWSLDNIPALPDTGYELLSWDIFPDTWKEQSGPTCLSEAGPRGFDAALIHRATNTGLEDSGRVAKTDAFISSLFKLGLGWNSVFFRYNEQSRKFEKHLRDVRVSGISLPALDGLTEGILECGMWMRKLRQFVASVPAQSGSPPSLASLARVIFILLYSIEDQLSAKSKTNPSLLQTNMYFRRISCLVKCLVDIVQNATRLTADVQVVSTVFAKCDHYSHQHLWLADIFHEIMGATSSLWLHRAAQWIGLRPAGGQLNASQVFDPGYIDEYSIEETIFNPDSMPSFIPREDADVIYETGVGLNLLRSSHKGHPLAEVHQKENTSSLTLEWGLTWEDINNIQLKAKCYEACLRNEILKYNSAIIGKAGGGSATPKEYTFDYPQEVNITIDDIYKISGYEDWPESSQSQSMSDCQVRSSRLYELVREGSCVNIEKRLIAEHTFGPPLESAPSLSFAPVILAQSRLVNFSCLHLLFKVHKVRDHLHLQERFQLLGNAEFLLRISLALFDPNMHSGERKSGVARGGSSTGLRLGNRNSWPPASSELRLVLTGLLSECYQGNSNGEHQHSGGSGSRDLPGGLSFSIRELTGEELERCKNPHSLEALDFLRIHYTPPSPLEEVITPLSLEKYDIIFKQLLRLIRMLSVVRDLVRSPPGQETSNVGTLEQRFRVEAFHFVQVVNDYSFQVGINHPWQQFEKRLSKIERCIDEGDVEGTITLTKGLRRLREYHERVLDRIILALFLNKSQLKARNMLEDVLRSILAYSFHVKAYQERLDIAMAAGRMPSSKTTAYYNRSIRELYSRFKKQVGGFIRFLRSLEAGGVKNMIDHDDDMDASADIDLNSIFEHLLLRLDMNEYY